jgi:hypothetical protein
MDCHKVSRIGSLALALACFSLLMRPVAAQGNSTAIVRIYASKSTDSTLAFFAPDELLPKRKQSIFSGLNMVFSPDGQWLAVYGLTAGSTTPQLAYSQVGQSLTRLALEPGYHPLSVHFSASGRYLSYTAVSYGEQRWIIGIVELASSKQITFAGMHSNDPSTADPAHTFRGVAEVLAWSKDDRSVILASVQPGTSSIARYNGLYRMTLGAISFENNANLSLAPMELLLSGDRIIGAPLVSPDATRIAYFTADNGRTAGSANPRNAGVAIGALVVRDTTTVSDQLRVQAATGESIGTAVWLPDSRSILYTAGRLQRGAYVGAARAYVLDVNEGSAIPGAILEHDSRRYVFSTMICGDSVFFVSKMFKADFSGEATLYRAPLADLASRSQPLASGQNIALLGCASPNS